MANREQPLISIPLKKYNEMLADIMEMEQHVVRLEAIMKQNGITLLPEEEYFETYTYKLHDNMRELKPLISDAIEMSPTHVKQTQMGGSAIMTLPEEVIQTQREMSIAEKEMQVAVQQDEQK